MVFPKVDSIYSYKGTKYVVLVSDIFRNVMAQNILNDNNDIHDNSHFYNFNWWKFMFSAKFVERKKISKAY